MQKRIFSDGRGFTIVELLVVIIVIGVLAAITMVSYTGVSQKAVSAALQSDLANYSRKLELYRAADANNGYPDSPVDAGIPAGSYSSYIRDNTASPKTFTITAQKVSAGTTIIYKVSNGSVPEEVLTYATGGNTVADIGGYRIHTFTSSGTFTVNAGITSVQVLVVAGGGGGSDGIFNVTFGNAGGGGTVTYNANYAVSPGPITVAVGAGGTGVMFATAGNGGNSVFGTITATGGTGPAYNQRSGGRNANYLGGTGVNYYSGGGGAGGGGAGSTLNGGIGFTSSISGTSVNYAGGGSSCAWSGGTWCGTAVDGGGVGNGDGNGTNGTANTGGGGGSANNNYIGGNGGSGIVIVRYLIP